MQSLHLHLVDLAHTGPTHHALRHKNLPLDDVLRVLRDELKGEADRPAEGSLGWAPAGTAPALPAGPQGQHFSRARAQDARSCRDLAHEG